MSIILQNPSLVLESRQSSRHFLKKTHAKTRKNSLNATMKRIRKLSCKPTHHKDSLENSIPKSQTGVETEDEETPLSLISKDSNPNTENKPFLNDLLNRYKTIEVFIIIIYFLFSHFLG